MKKSVKYILVLIISSILLLIALSINNMFWLGASPEWKTKFTVYNSFGHWTGPVQDYDIEELANYLIMYRIFTVWTNIKDIGSALIVGLIIMFFSIIYDTHKPFKVRR